MKTVGFTLAEVLVALAVIGVIAAITIPTLIQNTNSQQNKIAWKGAYSQLSQGVLSLIQDNGGSLKNVYSGDVAGAEAFKNALLTKLNFVKECKSTSLHGGTGSGSSSEGCWHLANKSQYLNGTKIGESLTPGLILNNGTLLKINFEKSDCSYLPSGINSFSRCGIIWADVNGYKGPNTVGKDIFVVNVLENMTKPEGALEWSNHPNEVCIEGNTDSNNYGWGCSAKYLYE